MSYTGLMQSVCTIERLEGSAPDSRGLVKPVWIELAAGVQCGLIPLTSEERIQAQGWQLEADARLALPAGTDVRSHPPDRVVLDEQRYLVTRVNTGRGKTLVAWLKRYD